MPATAKNLTITTPRTSCIYLLHKIHKPNNPARSMVPTCSCLTEIISSYLDKIMAVIVKTLPSYIKESRNALEIFHDFNFLGLNRFLSVMNITSLHTVIPKWRRSPGPQILFFYQRIVKEPNSKIVHEKSASAIIISRQNVFCLDKNVWVADWKILSHCSCLLFIMAVPNRVTDVN